jgi:hypothetical protein
LTDVSEQLTASSIFQGHFDMFLQLILNLLLSAISGFHGGEYEDDSA